MSSSDDDTHDTFWQTHERVSFPVKLEENMYGAVVYVWARRAEETGIFRYNKAVVTSGLFLLTLYIQIVFGWYMLPHVSLNEFEEKVHAVNQFVAWRAVANDSKANFTCTGKEWSWTEDVVDEMAKYNMPTRLLFTIPVTQGQMFGVLSMALWVCLLVIQMRAALASLSLLGLNDDKITGFEGYKTAPARQKLAFRQMRWDQCGIKIVILGTFLVRATATAGFGYYGMAFLAYTDNLRDFILNCVALAFVFDIPDLVYRAFAPLETEEEIRDINTAFAEARVATELVLSDNQRHAQVCCRQFFLAIFAIVPFLYGLKLLTAFGDMQANQVFKELCATVPGNTSQVFE